MYKLKIRGAVKSFTIPFAQHANDPLIDFAVQQYINAKAKKPRQKIHSCNLYRNNGEFVKSFSHLL